jgi:hypothetical protein
MRTIGPAAINSLFSLSIENGYLGGYLVYYVLIVTSCATLAFGSMLPGQIQRAWWWAQCRNWNAGPDPYSSTEFKTKHPAKCDHPRNYSESVTCYFLYTIILTPTAVIHLLLLFISQPLPNSITLLFVRFICLMPICMSSHKRPVVDSLFRQWILEL